MAEANANIKFTADTSQALESIRQLQRSISRLYSDMARGAAGAQSATAGMQQNLLNSVNATGQFTARLTTIRTTTESFTNSLEKNKLSLGQYFKFGVASTKNFGKVFTTEFNTIEKVARERVKDLQTQYIKMGRDANGAMKAIAVRPTTLDMTNLGTQTAIAAQKQQIFNQLLKQGTTNLLNFGKNTQWAGRQLMVGFTIPLSIFAVQAARSFQQLEAQAINFKRVYGDLFTTPEQTEMALTDMRKLALEFTKLGVSVEQTLELAAKVAQMGNTGAALTAQVTQATRLSVLGQMEQQEALDTTVGITNAFGISIENLAEKVNFLNAAENQTILSIQDFNEAVPRAGSVVAQLGGGVEDLAFFLTAMREGGIEASQGANALKTSLARLISPTAVATKELGALGINIKGIVESNAGDLKQTVIDLALALDTLDPLDKARAIEQLFGKFQFARMSALFQNIIDEGSQATRVLDLMAMTTGELAQLAERELGRVEESAATKFTSAIQKFRAELAPIGEAFLKLATPIIEWATGMLEAFNKLGEGGRGFVVGFLGVIGGLAPVLLMVIGLVANLIANIAKGVGLAFNFFKNLGRGSKELAEQTDYMTSEQIEAQTVAASLNQTHQDLTQTLTLETTALGLLADAYRAAAAEMRLFQGPIMTAGGMAARPQGNVPGFAKGRKVPGYKDGVIEVPGPKGKGDIIPAMLAPGEAVIPAKMAQRYGGLINAMIAGNIPGYLGGLETRQRRYGGVDTGATNPLESSHVSGRTPTELSATIQAWMSSVETGSQGNSNYADELGSTVLTVRTLGEELENGTRTVETSFNTLRELTEFLANNPTMEVLTSGLSSEGTSVPEPHGINRAFNVQHPDGSQVAAGTSMNLDGVILAGKRAQEALDSQSQESIRYKTELEALVTRARAAAEVKSQATEADRLAISEGRAADNETRAQEAFIRNQNKEILATRIEAANTSVGRANALEAAEKQLASADERLAAVRDSGIDEAEYLEQVEGMYGRLIFESVQARTRSGKEVTIPPPEVIVVPAGQGRGLGRSLASGRGSGEIVNATTGARANRASGDVPARHSGSKRVLAGREADFEASGMGADEAIAAAMATMDPKIAESASIIVKQTREGLAQAISIEVQSNSPAKKLVEVSRDISDGIQLGLEEAIPELQQTGAELGEAINDGAEQSQGDTPARRGNRRARMDETGTTDVMQGGEIIQTIYPPEVQQAQDLLAQANLQSAAKAQAFGDSAALVATKITDMSGKVAMASFALTSLLGAATQIPGPLGDIAGKLMPFAGGLSALAGAVRMVNAQKLIEVVGNKAKAVALAFNTATTKVATTQTVINTLAKRGETVASVQLTVAKRAETAATLVSGGIMKGLGIALGVLFGKVGLIILGLAALGVATWAIIKAIQDEEKRVRGLGDAAAFSAEQLKVLSDELGMQFRESVFASEVTAGQGSIDATEQNEVSKLRESEGFKEEFGGVDEIGSIIRTLKDATDADATRILAAQAAQLTALAKTEEDLAKIPIVLKAQLEEAGKEGIDVNILLPDLTTLDGIAQRVQETISPISNVGKLSSEQLSITRGEIESTVQVLEQMRAAGVIAPAEAAAQFDILAEAVAGMEDPGQKLELMRGVLEELSMDKLTEGIEDTDALMAILQNTMMGLKIDPADLEIFKEASETDFFGKTTADPEVVAQAKALADELIRTAESRALDNIAIEKTAEATRMLSADMQAANESLASQEETLSNQSLAYDRLIEAGFSAADAVAAVGNAALATAIASAEAGPDLDALFERVAAIAALEQEVETKLGTGRGRGGSGGGPQASFLDEITKKLRLFSNAQTSVTKGFEASMKSILEFADGANLLSGSFNGLNKQMRSVGLSENLIEMISGMDPDEYEKRKNELFIFDDKGTIIGVTAKLRSLNDAIGAVVVGEFINTQEQITNSVRNQITALNMLTAAGVKYEAAYRMVQNTALAAEIATARSSQMILAAANAAMKAQQMMDEFAAVNEEEERRKNIAKAVRAINKEFSNQAKILDYINSNRSRLSETQISEILTSKDLQALVLEPEIDPGALATALDNANRRAQLELSIKKLTVEGQDEIFQEGFGKAMDAFNAQSNKIEFEFEANIKDQRKIIKDAEEQIALLDFELQTYQNDLKDIEFQEDEINKAYDKRFEALDKIAEANAEISRQQQAQLDVADALSRGDIAGAARAVREARQASGEVAREQERKKLEQAQAAQLAALTSGRGLTREEAEARSLALEQQIFAIESERLQPAEELVRLAELKRDADTESLEILGKTREEYERIANAIDVARGNNWKSTEAIQEALNIAEQLIAELEKAKPVPVAPAPAPSGGGGGGGRSSSPAPAPVQVTGTPRGGKTDAGPSTFDGVGSGTPLLSAGKNYVPPTPRILDFRPTTTPAVRSPATPAPDIMQPDQRTPLAKAIDTFNSATRGFLPPITRTAPAQIVRNVVSGLNTVGKAVATGSANFFSFFANRRVARGGMIIPKRMSIGGVARRSRSAPPLQMLDGGRVRGPGTDMSDSIPALLSNGEYVIRASAVRNVGEDFLNKLNGGKIKPTEKDGVPGFFLGGLVKSIKQVFTPKPPPPPPSDRENSAALRGRTRAATPTPVTSPTRSRAPSSTPTAAPTSNGSDRGLLARAQAAQKAAEIPRQSMLSVIQQSQSVPAAPKFSDSFKMFDGTAVGAEQGFQNMAGAIASNENVQKFGNFLSGDTFGAGLTRGVLGALALPVEIMGAVAKNMVTIANPNATNSERLKSLIPGISVFQGVSNAMSGVLDPSKQRDMMFTQAGNYVADNRLFGATDAEGQARARLIGGALNLLGDPLLYAGGLGIARAGASTAGRVAMGTGKLTSGPAGSTTGILPQFLRPMATPSPVVFPSASVGNMAPASLGIEALGDLPVSLTGTTPESVIKAAMDLQSGPPNPALRSMLKNLEEGNFGKAETRLLDEMTASIFVDDLGIPTSSPNISGLDDVVRALAGDLPAQTLINQKRLNFENIIRENALKNRDIELLGSKEIADPSKVTAIHSTSHAINRDASGAIVLRPTGQYNPDVPRSSIHFTLEDMVKSHMFGEWGPEQQKIVAQLSSMMEKNGLPYNLNPIDTWWMRSPGQDLRLPPNSQVISPYTDLTKYSQELIKRGLLQPGKLPPVMAVDSTTNEILHILKNSYSPVDRFQIKRITGYTPRMGNETEALSAAALKAAKERLGTDTKARNLEQHGTTDFAFDESIRNLAATLGVRRGIHQGSIPGMLERIGIKSEALDSIKSVDSVDALRFATLRGMFKSVKTPNIDNVGDLDGFVAAPRPPAFSSPTQSRNFIDENNLQIIDTPLDTDFKIGIHKDVNFVKDLSGKKYFVKGHGGHYLNDFEMLPSFGYEFLAGRIGNLIGANTPQAHVISRGPEKAVYQVATDAIPSSAGLAPEKIEQIIMASSNPQKTLTDMLKAYADFNEVTPALNSVFNNRDLHRNNIMWDNLNRRFMQIDMGSSAPNSLRYPPGSEAFKNNRVHHGISESKEGAIRSMAIVRAAISDAIDTAINFGFLNRPSQLSLAERARSLGFSVSPDNQSLNPLKGVFKKATVSTDLSGAYSKIMNLDIEGLPSQLAQGLGLKNSAVNNIDKGLITKLKERAEVLAEITSNPKITIGQGDQVPGYRMGGLIPYKATGGIFKSLGSDTIPAMLTPGEYVIRKSAVENFGVDNLEKINNGTYDSSSMYNYNLSINVKSESNPEQIARTVIDQIKRIDSQRIRGNRY